MELWDYQTKYVNLHYTITELSRFQIRNTIKKQSYENKRFFCSLAKAKRKKAFFFIISLIRILRLMKTFNSVQGVSFSCV